MLFFSQLCVFALRFVETNDDAEDIVQNVFISVWNKRSQLKSDVNIKSYLYTSVRNGCLNYIRSLKTKETYGSELSYEFKQIELEYTDHLVEKDNIQRIYDAIDSLPDQCKEVFKLRRFEDFTNDEIAIKLGITKKSVEVYMFRAMKKLREVLK